MNNVFKLGEPIPKVWLYMEFDFNDTLNYMGDKVIETEEELDRLTKKYGATYDED